MDAPFPIYANVIGVQLCGRIVIVHLFFRRQLPGPAGAQSLQTLPPVVLSYEDAGELMAQLRQALQKEN